jgi:hypothetical protein
MFVDKIGEDAWGSLKNTFVQWNDIPVEGGEYVDRIQKTTFDSLKKWFSGESQRLENDIEDGVYKAVQTIITMLNGNYPVSCATFDIINRPRNMLFTTFV